MASYLIEKDKLKGEYSKAFDRVESYVLVKGIDEETSEEMLMNLVDILYCAQTDNKPVEKIVGRDIDKFCKEYFGDYKSWKSSLRHFPRWLYWVMCIFFLGSILDLCFPEENETVYFWTAKTEVSGYFFGLLSGLVAGLLFWGLGRILWKRFKNIRSGVLAACYFVIVVIAIIASVICSSGIDWEISLAPVILISAAYIVVYWCWQFYDRYKKHGSLKKPPKDGSLREIFNESMKETMVKELPLELKKLYDKKNRKLAKRGKPELSPEEYMDYLHKQDRNLARGNFLTAILYIVIFVVSVAGVAIDSTWSETLGFAVVEAVILGTVYWGIDKIYKAGGTRAELLARCEAEGITVIEMARRIEEAEAKEEAEEEKDAEEKEKTEEKEVGGV